VPCLQFRKNGTWNNSRYDQLVVFPQAFSKNDIRHYNKDPWWAFRPPTGDELEKYRKRNLE
jgi:hypothetical protein